ncbi:MAG: elongation factor P [Planctomycetota bacterium]|nr:MAG: elongation factor P [Planctomycetota bacterium]
MSITDRLHKGMVIRHEGELFTVLDYQLAQTGKQKPTVHIKLRSLRSGHTGERTLDQLGKVEEVPSEVRQMQYLYAAGEEHVFMDTESYEQYPLNKDILEDGLDFLVEEETYRFLTVEGQPVALQLPPAAVLEVTETAPVEHAGGSSNVYKEAKLASGLVVQVPLFIKNGDKIRVGIDKREYLGKEH